MTFNHLWKHTWELPDTDSWKIRGYSRARFNTCFFIEPIAVYLDAGLNGWRDPNAILVSHAHSDHSFHLPMILTGIETEPVVCAPATHMRRLKDAFHAKRMLSTRDDSPVVMPVKENITWEACGPRHRVAVPSCGIEVTSIPLDHTIDAMGYVIEGQYTPPRDPNLDAVRAPIRAAHKAAADQAKREGVRDLRTHLDALVSAGELAPIPRHPPPEQRPLVAFLTDTRITPLLPGSPDEALIFACRTIIVECSFLGEEMRADAEARGHVCWADLGPVVRAHPENTFMLIHFSARYKDEDIVAYFSTLDGGPPPNVLLWLDGGPLPCSSLCN